MVVAPLPAVLLLPVGLGLHWCCRGGPHGRNGRGGTNLQRYVNVLVDNKGGPWRRDPRDEEASPIASARSTSLTYAPVQAVTCRSAHDSLTPSLTHSLTHALSK
jgi:hypothetical protein